MHTRAESSLRDEDLPPERIYKGEITGQLPPTVVEFESTDDMLDFLRRTKPVWKPRTLGIHISDRVARGDDSGTDDWATAMRLARHGWPDGRRLLTQAESRGLSTGMGKSRKWNYDMAGAMPDVQRFLGGDPEHMVDYMPSNHGRKPVISVCVSPMCAATVTPTQRANWGAALLSWVEAEEVMGFRVDMNVIYVTDTEMLLKGVLGGKIVVKYRLKSEGMQRSVDDLAFWLMHNAAHHRLQFGIRECLDVRIYYESHPPYGIAVEDPVEIGKHLPDNEILLVLGKGANSVAEGLDMIYADIERHREAQKAA